MKRDNPRSNAGLKLLHGWAQKELDSKLTPHLKESPDLKKQFTITGLSEVSASEETVEGAYYPKNVDILVKTEDEPIGIVSIKFVISNYRQNSNNYFEGGMGETANLRRRNIVYGHLFCLTNPIPYKARSGRVKKYETISDGDIRKYYRLRNDHEHLHAPHELALGIADLDTENNKITGLTDPSSLTNDPELQGALNTTLGLDHFFGSLALRLILRRLSP